MNTKPTPISIPGLNVQAPWAQLIVDGKKVIETRTYPLPKHYVGKEVAIVETGGKTGLKGRRIVGIVVFSESFRYPSKKEFEKDYRRHLVDSTSDFFWDSKLGKWGWPILKAKQHRQEIPKNVRGGILYYKSIPLKG